jgi:hypothetical protein
MIHHRERLPLLLEPRDDLRVSIPNLMIFNATRRLTGRSCSAIQNRTESTLANHLEEFILSDLVARPAPASFARVPPRFQALVSPRSRDYEMPSHCGNGGTPPLAASGRPLPAQTSSR